MFEYKLFQGTRQVDPVTSGERLCGFSKFIQIIERGDCLSKTQVDVKSKTDEVYPLTPALVRMQYE